MNQFGGGGFVNLYLEMYVSNIKKFLLRILRNRRGTELFLRIDDAQVFKQQTNHMAEVSHDFRRICAGEEQFAETSIG